MNTSNFYLLLVALMCAGTFLLGILPGFQVAPSTSRRAKKLGRGVGIAFAFFMALIALGWAVSEDGFSSRFISENGSACRALDDVAVAPECYDLVLARLFRPLGKLGLFLAFLANGLLPLLVLYIPGWTMSSFGWLGGVLSGHSDHNRLKAKKS